MNINWVEYFREFCRVHGQSPVLFRYDPNTGKGGCLLFPDGWTYGREPSGPEVAPPTELKKHIHLIKSYWGIRLRISQEELRRKTEELRDLVRLQASRSAPLVVPDVVKYEDDDGKVTRRVEYSSIDFSILLLKLRELRDSVEECRGHLTVSEIEIPVYEGAGFSQASVLAELEEIESYKERANGRAS